MTGDVHSAGKPGVHYPSCRDTWGICTCGGLDIPQLETEAKALLDGAEVLAHELQGPHGTLDELHRLGDLLRSIRTRCIDIRGVFICRMDDLERLERAGRLSGYDTDVGWSE